MRSGENDCVRQHRPMDEGYPPQTQLESDIEKGNCYLISTDDNRAIATFAFIKGVDPTYLKIEGEGWLNEEPYGTIHRVASAPAQGASWQWWWTIASKRLTTFASTPIRTTFPCKGLWNDWRSGIAELSI